MALKAIWRFVSSWFSTLREHAKERSTQETFPDPCFWTRVVPPDNILALVYPRQDELPHSGPRKRDGPTTGSLAADVCSDEELTALRDPLFDILTALACISVSAPDQIIAIALSKPRLDSSSLTLYVSANGDVPADVVDRLQDVWRRIVDYNCAVLRNRDVERGVEGEPREILLQLQIAIYTYCLEVFGRQLKGRYTDFIGCMDSLPGRDSALLIGCPCFSREELARCAKLRDQLQLVKRIFDDEMPNKMGTPEAKAGIISDQIAVEFREWWPIMEDDKDMFLDRVQQTTGFPLHEYLAGVFSLQKHFLVLAGMARTPCFAPFLREGAMSIECVPPVVRPFNMDLALASWSRLIGGIQCAEVDEKVAAHLLESFRSKMGIEPDCDTCAINDVTVHPECALLAYLDARRDVAVCPPIGVSESSCLGCSLYFKAYHCGGGAVAAYVQSGDKICFPWVNPDFGHNERFEHKLTLLLRSFLYWLINDIIYPDVIEHRTSFERMLPHCSPTTPLHPLHETDESL